MRINNPWVRFLVATILFAVALFFIDGAIDNMFQIQEAINIIYGG